MFLERSQGHGRIAFWSQAGRARVHSSKWKGTYHGGSDRPPKLTNRGGARWALGRRSNRAPPERQNNRRRENLITNKQLMPYQSAVECGLASKGAPIKRSEAATICTCVPSSRMIGNAGPFSGAQR